MPKYLGKHVYDYRQHSMVTGWGFIPLPGANRRVHKAEMYAREVLGLHPISDATREFMTEGRDRA